MFERFSKAAKIRCFEISRARKAMHAQGLNENSASTGRKHERMSRSAGLWRRYSFAVLFVLTAFGIRYLMTPVLGEELPFMLFIAAALVAAWYGGAVSGIIALLVGLFLGDYFFLWPTQTAPMSRSMVIVHLVRYVFTASLGIVLIETLHRSRRRLEQAKDILRMHPGELEKRVA